MDLGLTALHSPGSGWLPAPAKDSGERKHKSKMLNELVYQASAKDKKKINWQASQPPLGDRGQFTLNKEAISEANNAVPQELQQ